VSLQPQRSFAASSNSWFRARPRPHVSEEVLNHWAKFTATPLTLGEMQDFGLEPDLDTVRESALFLMNEIPVRLSQMAKDLECLPANLFATDPVRLVHGWYLTSLSEFINMHGKEMKTKEELDAFTTVVRNTLTRHAPVVPMLTRGILQVKEEIGVDKIPPAITHFLDRFHMSRIAIRMLLSQHSEMWVDVSASEKPNSDWVGIIERNCKPADIARDAAVNASNLCMQVYASTPQVDVIQANKLGDVCFSYVPSHLYHIIFELLKNSLRATVEHHGVDYPAVSHRDFPRVKVIISQGEHDVSIKVADQGGGIARAHMRNLFDYLFTTAPTPDLDTLSDMNHAPLAGLGYGLPLSRVYANYFGGDLKLVSLEGYGTDAYVHLNYAQEQKREQLPSYSHIHQPREEVVWEKDPNSNKNSAGHLSKPSKSSN